MAVPTVLWLGGGSVCLRGSLRWRASRCADALREGQMTTAWAVLFSVFILRPIAWPVDAREFPGPLCFTPWRWECLAFHPFEHPSEISLAGITLLENIFKLKMNVDSNQNHSLVAVAFPQKF